MTAIDYIFYGFVAAWVLFRIAIVAGFACFVVLAIQLARGKW